MKQTLATMENINNSIDDLKQSRDLGYFKGNTHSHKDNLNNLAYLKSELSYLMKLTEDYTTQVEQQQRGTILMTIQTAKSYDRLLEENKQLLLNESEVLYSVTESAVQAYVNDFSDLVKDTDRKELFKLMSETIKEHGSDIFENFINDTIDTVMGDIISNKKYEIK